MVLGGSGRHNIEILNAISLFLSIFHQTNQYFIKIISTLGAFAGAQSINSKDKRNLMAQSNECSQYIYVSHTQGLNNSS